MIGAKGLDHLIRMEVSPTSSTVCLAGASGADERVVLDLKKKQNMLHLCQVEIVVMSENIEACFHLWSERWSE